MGIPKTGIVDFLISNEELITIFRNV